MSARKPKVPSRFKAQINFFFVGLILCLKKDIDHNYSYYIIPIWAKKKHFSTSCKKYSKEYSKKYSTVVQRFS